jgi:hypothetical protein
MAKAHDRHVALMRPPATITMLVNKKLEAAPGFEDLNNELAKLKLGMVSLVEAVQKVDYADHAPKHRPVRSYESNDLRSINFRRRSQCFAV